MARTPDSPVHSGMRNAAVALDELVMATLLPAPEVAEDDKLVSIEIVDDDLVLTDPFARLSSPYERVDIEPMRESSGPSQSGPHWSGPRLARPRKYATTVQVFDPAWFDRPADVADEAPASKQSWLWLALSIVVAAGVVAGFLVQ
jgi:hypothetical protein